jgi:hypothetical protein
VITVGLIIPRQGCTSAEPASASSDSPIYITKHDRRKHFYQSEIGCLSNRLFVDSLKIDVSRALRLLWKTFYGFLGRFLDWFHDVFKTIGKNHPCRHIDVGRPVVIAGRNHEEMDRDASDQ